METLAVEIEALRVVAPLLSDDGDSGNDRTSVAATSWTAPPSPIQVPKGGKTDPQPDHFFIASEYVWHGSSRPDCLETLEAI